MFYYYLLWKPTEVAYWNVSVAGEWHGERQGIGGGTKRLVSLCLSQAEQNRAERQSPCTAKSSKAFDANQQASKTTFRAHSPYSGAPIDMGGSSLIRPPKTELSQPTITSMGGRGSHFEGVTRHRNDQTTESTCWILNTHSAAEHSWTLLTHMSLGWNLNGFVEQQRRILDTNIKNWYLSKIVS